LPQPTRLSDHEWGLGGKKMSGPEDFQWEETGRQPEPWTQAMSCGISYPPHVVGRSIKNFNRINMSGKPKRAPVITGTALKKQDFAGEPPRRGRKECGERRFHQSNETPRQLPAVLPALELKVRSLLRATCGQDSQICTWQHVSGRSVGRTVCKTGNAISDKTTSLPLGT
jgi:hypothetical protein